MTATWVGMSWRGVDCCKASVLAMFQVRELPTDIVGECVSCKASFLFHVEGVTVSDRNLRKVAA